MSVSPNQSSDQAIARWGINPMVPYLGGIATWFLANGLQFVMIPTLVIITLGGTAGDLAAAQVALAVPQVFLMMGQFTGRHTAHCVGLAYFFGRVRILAYYYFRPDDERQLCLYGADP